MDLLKRPKELVLNRVVRVAERNLEKLQTRLRFVGNFIPANSTQEIRPALPHGPDFERFQNATEALKSWPDKQTQWWYFTGQVKNKEGREFGFQFVTFERHSAYDFFGVLPTRIWTEEFYVAHFAVSNLQPGPGEKSFRYFQRGGLLPHNGFSSEERFHVDLEGWQMHQNDDGSFLLSASENGTSLNLTVTPTKGLCYHGQNGYAAKSARVEDGSLYCSYPRMEARGKLLIDGVLHEVTGTTWMDHEKMASQDEVFHHGWDWYSLQLSDGSDLMLYLLKDAAGNLTEHAMGTYFTKDSEPVAIAAKEIYWERLRYWQSPHSKARYPVSNRIRIPKLGIDLQVEARLEDQEMDTSKTAFVTYWEGAVSAEGTCAGQPVRARGYLEMVGYDKRPKSQIFKFLTRSGRG